MDYKKVLLFYMRSGGGHFSIAKAIKDSIHEHYPNEFQIDIFDAIPESDHIGQFIIHDGYNIASNYLRPLYALIYYFNFLKPMMRMNFKTTQMHALKNMQAIILEKKPDVIVLTHPLLITTARLAVQHLEPKPVILHTVLDLKPGPWCFADKEMLTTVSFPEIAELAQKKYGLKKEKLFIIPPPLRTHFYQKLSQAEIDTLKEKYGFRKDKKLVLITGGAGGLPSGVFIVLEVLRQNIDADIVVVCGRDIVMKQQVDWLVKHKDHKNQVIQSYGFTETIHELMQCSDVIVSKAGFSTIFEVLTLEKIFIISKYIAGQEKGNADFVAENNLGFLIQKPKKVAAVIKKIIDNPQLSKTIHSQIEKLPRTNGSKEIAQLIRTLAQKQNQSLQEKTSVLQH